MHPHAALRLLHTFAALGLTAILFGTASAQPAIPSRTVQQESADARYAALQKGLAKGWNTWDVNSMTTHVLLPEGLAIHVQFKQNGTVAGDEFLARSSVGQGTVFPGPHAWDGSYTQLKVTWQGHHWSVDTAHDGSDLVLLVTPLDKLAPSALPPTAIFAVDYLWGRSGSAVRLSDSIEARANLDTVHIYCTCSEQPRNPSGAYRATHQDDAHPGRGQLPVSGAYLSAELTQPVGISTGKRRSVAQIAAILDRQRAAYRASIGAGAPGASTVDAIETTLGWDTIYDPDHGRVISPVSRDWSRSWGGYVLFEWDTFFGATLAGIGDKNLAYANAIEMLREETPQGFVPNYARAGEWKSSDRSEPPVGAITVWGLYRKYGDRWLLQEAYEPLLRWNRWWALHRDIQGYLAWGSDGQNQPEDMGDNWRGTRAGAILESGLDNSPMYDDAVYNKQTHLLEFADVGLMSLYIADCDALANMADILQRPEDAKELRARGKRYRQKLDTLWSEQDGIFLNKDLHTGHLSPRLSPTNFYPLLAHAATAQQAHRMVKEHLLNSQEFWGQWVIPSVPRSDPAFKDQNYWRGRIWGPMNYLVYLGLARYGNDPFIGDTRREVAQKSFALFSNEWGEKGHVHENYNALTGTGDDVKNSDRFYHWGALLGYVEYLEETSMAH